MERPRMISDEDLNEMAAACLALDRLQVELSPKSPYKTPSPKECRERILRAMDHLEKVSVAIGLQDPIPPEKQGT